LEWFDASWEDGIFNHRPKVDPGVIEVMREQL
jgi:hypothetical protein